MHDFDYVQDASCIGNATFVTLLSGERYASAASCLPKQLAQMNSSCPLLLVFNDKDSSIPLDKLRSAYSGRHSMLPLSTLTMRHPAHEQSTRSSGRMLLSTSREATTTHLKIWLWALRLPGRAVFLDLDILLVRNVDELLRIQPENRANGAPGIGAVTCKSKYGDRFFNSGIFIFSPSLRTLGHLLELARFASSPWNGHIPHRGDRWPKICSPPEDPWAAKRLFPNASKPLAECRNHYGPGKQPSRMTKACETKLTDQSIFNAYFHTHTLLPKGFNLASYSPSEVNHHIVHFVGEPKPWSGTPFSGARARDPQRQHAIKEWQRRCEWVAPAAGTPQRLSKMNRSAAKLLQ